MKERTRNHREFGGAKLSFDGRHDQFYDREVFVHPRGKRSLRTQDFPLPYSLSSTSDNKTIRLLDLQPGTDNDQLQGRLITVSLDSKLQYYAISYVWDDSLGDNVICVDGRCVLLGDHISAILKTLRQIKPGMLLWVDAICIDQQDNHTLGSQLPLMHTIFSSAQAVICCLGEETDPRKKEQAASSVRTEATYNANRVFSGAQIVERLPNQAKSSCEYIKVQETGHTAIPSFDFGYQRPGTIQLAENPSKMEPASTWPNTQTPGRSPSTVSSDCEGMGGGSNTTPESSASEGELSFTGDLYSDGDSDEDVERATFEESLFVAIKVEGLLRSFRKKQQEETVHLRSCTGPNATSTSSRSSDTLLLPDPRSCSSQHGFNSKRPWRVTNGDDEDGEDREKRRKQVTMLEHTSESTLKLFACPYSKYDSRRYSPQNLHEKHYRHCSSIFSTSISRLKQHMYRVHKRPEYYCDRCFAEFSCHQHLANHSRNQLSCNLIESPFDEKMTHDQASLIKRRSGRQSPSDAWFFIYRTLFPMCPLPASPFAEGTTSPNAQSFGDFFDSQTEGLLRSFRAQVARRMPSLAERERQALDSILEECLGRMNVEEYNSTHDTSPNAAEDGYRSVPLALSRSIAISETVPIDEANPRLPEQYAVSAPLTLEIADTNIEMSDIFEPQPASSSNVRLEETTFGDIFTEWDSNGLFDGGEDSTQSLQVMIDEVSTSIPVDTSCVDPRDCTHNDSTQV